MSDAERPVRVGGAVQQPAVDAAVSDYTGRIRSDRRGGITGWLVDRLGARIHFTGVRDVAGGGYLVRGTVQIPEYLQIDGEKP